MLVSDLVLFFIKALNEVKASDLQLNFNISTALNLTYNENKLYRTFRLFENKLSRDILNFVVSPPHLVYDFSN